jgi:hypothetical protein
VRWDIRAIERLMGMYDAQGAGGTSFAVQSKWSGNTTPNNMGLGANGAGANPPSAIPVQVVFGGPNSIQFQGYISSLDYTYTMFSAEMIPTECTVDITVLRQYLPYLSDADLVNPLVIQGPFTGSAATFDQSGNITSMGNFPYSPTSNFNPQTGIVQINTPGSALPGISL